MASNNNNTAARVRCVRVGYNLTLFAGQLLVEFLLYIDAHVQHVWSRSSDAAPRLVRVSAHSRHKRCPTLHPHDGFGYRVTSLPTVAAEVWVSTFQAIIVFDIIAIARARTEQVNCELPSLQSAADT